MTNDEDQFVQLGWELGQAIQTAVAASFERNFADVVHDYRQIEADFVARPGGNEFHVLETKRRIAEAILLAAHSHEQPFEVCQEIWNELLTLGFTNHQTKRSMTYFYADCCLNNEQYDTGLDVIDPVITEFEQSLREKTLKPEIQELCDRELTQLKFLREGLIAFNTGEAEANAWMAREQAEIEARRRSAPEE